MKTTLQNLDLTNTVVFMMGAACAGKSTVIKGSCLTSLPLVDADRHKERHPDYDPANAELVHEWSKIEARKEMLGYMSQGESFIVDGTGRNSARMVKEIQEVQAIGYRAVVVYVQVSLQTSLRRQETRTRKVPVSVIREQHELMPISFEHVSRYADAVYTVNND